MPISLSLPSLQFVAQLAQHYHLSEDAVMDILQADVQGTPVARIEEGEIKAINTRALAHASTNLLNSIHHTQEKIKLLNLCEINFTSLSGLEELEFVSLPDAREIISSYSLNDNTRLRTLTFRFHRVKTLDLGACTQLEDLDCSNNNLEQLHLQSNLQLEKLNVQINALSALDLSPLSNLRHLNLRYNPLNEACVTFPVHNTIKNLYLDETEFSSIDLESFSHLQKLKIGAGIKQLNVTSCTDLQSVQFIRTQLNILDISQNSQLTDLTLWEGNIKEVMCNELQAFLIPVLARKLKLKPDAAQKDILQTLQLHQKAISHNWDDGTAALHKILKHPLCDRATATIVYWMGQPGYYLKYKNAAEVPSHEKDMFKFLTKLENKLSEGAFPHNLIALDPKDYLSQNWTSGYDNASVNKRQIPDFLKEALKGSEITGFDRQKILRVK